LLQERQQAEEEAKMKEAELMRGNPLINMNNSGSFNVKIRLGIVMPTVLYCLLLFYVAAILFEESNAAMLYGEVNHVWYMCLSQVG
jgi:hypothetical protein